VRCCLLVLLLLLWTCTGTAQGLLIFNNRVANSVEAPIYNLDPSNPAFAQYGNGVVYNGAPLAGAGFTGQLFGGPTNRPLEQLTAIEPSAVFRIGDAAGHIIPPNRAVAVPDVPEGQRAKVQLRAWDNRGGTITNWEQAVANPTVALGASLSTITPPLGSVFTAPPNLVGLQSFSLALPIRLSSLRRTANGNFRFDYINPTGIPYCIEASTDLKLWSGLGNIPAGNGSYADTTAANQSHRFYRVVPCD